MSNFDINTLKQYENLYEELWSDNDNSSDTSNESNQNDQNENNVDNKNNVDNENISNSKNGNSNDCHNRRLKIKKKKDEIIDCKDSCPICGKDSNIIKDNGYSICESCGLILDDNSITDRPEWNDDSNNDRCGLANNMLLFESSLSTNIATPAYNSSRQRRLLNKLQLWQLMPSKERVLKDDFNTINSACGTHLPKCVSDYAQVLYKMAEDSRREEDETHRADVRVGLLAAAVFYAAKIHEYPKTYKEIAGWFEIDESYVTIGIKIFFRLMCNKIGMTNLITTHKSYVDKYCNNLGLSKEVREVAHDIANKAVTLGILIDNTPSTIAASAIYFVINMYAINIGTSTSFT